MLVWSASFNNTFDVYPKSDVEMVTLWEKLNYLAGQTYPHWSDSDASGGRGMISPYTELTIGQMYSDTPGYISALTYNVMDTGTYETVFAKLPKTDSPDWKLISGVLCNSIVEWASNNKDNGGKELLHHIQSDIGYLMKRLGLME